MSILSLRPTFETILPYSQEMVFERIRQALSRSPWNATSLVFDRYAELHIPESETRYWSPHLTLTFDGDEQHTRVVGRLAPRQNVWTLVWISYMAMAFAGFFALLYSYSSWLLGKSTWIVAVFPLSLFGIALLYIVSYIGQSWSSDQMAKLRGDWDLLVSQLFPEPEQP